MIFNHANPAQSKVISQWSTPDDSEDTSDTIKIHGGAPILKNGKFNVSGQAAGICTSTELLDPAGGFVDADGNIRLRLQILNGKF